MFWLHDLGVFAALTRRCRRCRCCRFIIFNAKFISLSTKFIIGSTKFVVFSANFIILNTDYPHLSMSFSFSSVATTAPTISSTLINVRQRSPLKYIKFFIFNAKFIILNVKTIHQFKSIQMMAALKMMIFLFKMMNCCQQSPNCWSKTLASAIVTGGSSSIQLACPLFAVFTAAEEV